MKRRRQEQDEDDVRIPRAAAAPALAPADAAAVAARAGRLHELALSPEERARLLASMGRAALGAQAQVDAEDAAARSDEPAADSRAAGGEA